MEGQKKQQEWMHLQQASQLEMVESMRERGRVAAEEARRAATLPRPMLQKFTERTMWRATLTHLSVPLPSSSGPKRRGLCSWPDCSQGMQATLLAPASARGNDQVKAAILKWYDISAETY